MARIEDISPTYRHGVTEPEMRKVPEGWFSMGCPADDPAGRDDERPLHRVWVDAFELAAYQTTNAEYARFLSAAHHSQPTHWNDAQFNDPRQPVVAVSWFDAVAYCDWLSHVTGKRYRLPTEAEWERAARGSNEASPYPWGNTLPADLPDYASRWKNGPERVGIYSPIEFGLYNLGDNVHEWCSDWYDAAYYSVSADRNPTGPASGIRRASRGGSWRHQIKVTRTAARSSIPPELKYADYGFRIARS